MGRRLYVGNLSYSTTEAGLRDAFGQCGTVRDVKVITDRETGRSRGFGFVEMSSDAEATAATAEWNGRELDGRSLVVNEAQDRRQSSGGGPPPRQQSYGGGGGGGGGGRRDRGKRRDRDDWD